MSSKTKIFVIRTKELIYTIVFVALLILLIFLLVQMFSKKPQKTEDYNISIPSSQAVADASLGIRRSPLGDTDTVPTFGPSGRQDLLNCCAKNLL